MKTKKMTRTIPERKMSYAEGSSSHIAVGDTEAVGVETFAGGNSEKYVRNDRSVGSSAATLWRVK